MCMPERETVCCMCLCAACACVCSVCVCVLHVLVCGACACVCCMCTHGCVYGSIGAELGTSRLCTHLNVYLSMCACVHVCVRVCECKACFEPGCPPPVLQLCCRAAPVPAFPDGERVCTCVQVRAVIGGILGGCGDRLTLLELIGQGASGQVYRGARGGCCEGCSTHAHSCTCAYTFARTPGMDHLRTSIHLPYR